MGASPTDAVAAAQASAAAAVTDNNESTTRDEHWVAIEFVDKAGLPVSGYVYRLTDPDGAASEGMLPRDGTVRRDGLSEGPCTVVVMNVSRARWSTDAAQVGESVGLSARVVGFEDGTEALFQIYRRDVQGPDVPVGEIRTTVEGGAVETEWVYARAPGAEKIESDDRPPYSAPAYYFEVVVGHVVARSGWLHLRDYIEIRLQDRQGGSVGNEGYVLRLSDGAIRRGTVDADGYKREDNVTPGPWHLHVPNDPDCRVTEQQTGGDAHV